MISIFKNTSNNKIGLDITPDGINIAVVQNQKGGFYLKNFAHRYFSKQIYQNGQIQDSELLVEELKSIINEHKFDTRTTILSVPVNNIFMKTITLPDIPEEELRVIAPQEASKHLPLNEKEMNIDFQILKNTRKQGESGRKVNVVLCAISKEIVKNYLEPISTAGLHVCAIDVSSFAMIRALANAELINNPEKTYVSVLIDYAGTDINIVQNGMPVFSHSIETGRKHIIDSIINSINKKKNEVLDILPEIALIIPGTEMSESPELNKASNAAKSVYSGIAGEIQKTIEFYISEQDNPIEIDSVLIGGGGVCVQNIDKYMFNKLRIKTNIFNPFINISEELQNQEDLFSPINITSYSTSIGLALKEVKN